MNAANALLSATISIGIAQGRAVSGRFHIAASVRGSIPDLAKLSMITWAWAWGFGAENPLASPPWLVAVDFDDREDFVTVPDRPGKRFQQDRAHTFGRQVAVPVAEAPAVGPAGHHPGAAEAHELFRVQGQVDPTSHGDGTLTLAGGSRTPCARR